MRIPTAIGAILALCLTAALAEPQSEGAKRFAPGQQSGPAKKSAPGQLQTYPGEAKKFAPGQQTRKAKKKKSKKKVR